MKKEVFGLLISSLLVLGACEDSKDLNTKVIDSRSDNVPLSIEEVKNVYSQNCSSCHGQVLANGVPGGLDKIGAELSEGEIEKIILDGEGMMLGGLIKDDEASALAKWLSTMK